MTKRSGIVVAGHICLDLIPEIPQLAGGAHSLLAPGSLINVGPVHISTGGAVSNTGLALHRMGLPVRLMGKIGDDPLGNLVLHIIRSHRNDLADGMIVLQGEQTSYTIVISPPATDRTFLHYPGANDTFCADDVDLSRLAQASLFHFGYPPLMRKMFSDDGVELTELFGRVKDLGLTTSLDMALPDPRSQSGRVDWRKLLEHLLPLVDVFLPSLDEILFMLETDPSGSLTSDGFDAKLLASVSQELTDMGAGIVGLKLGDQGFYLRTTSSHNRLGSMGSAGPTDLAAWAGRELYSPCFSVDVTGTTGAGDSTIAGFLAGLINGFSPTDAVVAAVATGAYSVEAPDATSGIPSWESIQDRIYAGWARRTPAPVLCGWGSCETEGVLRGPNDKTSRII